LDISGGVLEGDELATARQRNGIFELALPTPFANDANPFLSNSVLKLFGIRGAELLFGVGPHADRHDKSLIHIVLKGSRFGADLQSDAR
jgi:hypothetical protein